MVTVNPALRRTKTSSRIYRLPVAGFRILRVAFHICYGLLLAAIYPALGRTEQRRIVKHWSRKLLDVLRIGLETQGLHHPANMQGSMLVANHVSWLDAVAMNAVAPSCFVAKSEVGEWPLLGWMFQRIHTLFIRRDLRQDTACINRRIFAMLVQGERIALFPEGTTTDGAQPGHFHSSLLQGLIDASAAIYPVAIRYHDGKGEFNSDAAYVGDMNLIQSLWKVLCSPSMHVTLVYLPPLLCTGKHRRVLASEAQGAIHIALSRLSGDAVHVPVVTTNSGNWNTVLPAAHHAF